eukprot:672571-Alexandrium_andersonii.AAC.1
MRVVETTLRGRAVSGAAVVAPLVAARRRSESASSPHVGLPRSACTARPRAKCAGALVRPRACASQCCAVAW